MVEVDSHLESVNVADAAAAALDVSAAALQAYSLPHKVQSYKLLPL